MSECIRHDCDSPRSAHDCFCDPCHLKYVRYLDHAWNPNLLGLGLSPEKWADACRRVETMEEVPLSRAYSVPSQCDTCEGTGYVDEKCEECGGKGWMDGLEACPCCGAQGHTVQPCPECG